MYYELTDHFEVAADPVQTWAFFSTAENLSRITPPSLGLTIATPTPVRIEAGAVLDYTIRWLGLSLKWRTRIIDWSPPRQFIDLQTRGPYALWHHQHEFEPSADGRHTICRDRVIYKLPGGRVIGAIGHGLVVRRELIEVFRFRRRAIGEYLGLVRFIQDDVEIRRLL